MRIAIIGAGNAGGTLGRRSPRGRHLLRLTFRPLGASRMFNASPDQA